MPTRRSDARKSDGPVVAAAAAAAAQPVPAPSDEDDDFVAAQTSATTSTSPATKTPPSEATAVVAMADRKDKEHKSDTKDSVSIEDLALPKSIITRLAKGVLPPNTQIQANAILALSKGATVFISYLASHANEHTKNAGKKTISPADVFKALDDTEYSFLREPLEAEFASRQRGLSLVMDGGLLTPRAEFSAVQTEKRSSYRQKVRAAKDCPPTKHDDTDMADAKAVSEPSVGSPRVKRPRVQSPLRDTAETKVEEDSDAAGIEDGDEEEADDEDDDGDDDGDDDDDEASSDETRNALRRRIPDEDEEDEEDDESD